ncbi:5-oxoprolinase subunit PxpB [Sporosarcina limicola]|uniref:Inhibitor of KinA n=1 Tax=Sporosarcina limicola TaxID=34101 RepID=A0A927MNB2_9BACL|nr:5-oxoprolinase subunit PxpB [Sporosarcina limicola]MBE1556032.1 inhibitor of KinA [Sporosarcina limicola]
MNREKMSFPQVMVTGEQSIRFQFGEAINQETYSYVQAFSQLIIKRNHHLLAEIVPSYHAVTIYLKKEVANSSLLIDELLMLWSMREVFTPTQLTSRQFQIPVCYDEKFSEDMDRIINITGLSREEVISLHTTTSYTVYMIGFLPGFPYLGELPEALHVPRLGKPRLLVPKGTVGIGGNQTGIYPLESPGGWNILGRTPLDLYCPNRKEPFLLQAGDYLSFVPIPIEEYRELEHQLAREPEAIYDLVKEESRCESI